MAITSRKVDSPHGVITLFTITNASGASVELSSLGAGIVAVNVPDSKGEFANVVIGYKDPADYFDDGPCAGKTPGRCANRMAKAELPVDGKIFHLSQNKGINHLHGGPMGFQNRIWDCETKGDDTVVFTYHSTDGEEGYPGNLVAKVTYRWTADNELVIDYDADTDAPTAVNLTNHAYFNLAGENSGSVLDHELKFACSKWLPTTTDQIPTGEIATVKGTPMDFTEFKAIGRDIKADFEALKIGKGYDHCFVVDDWMPGEMTKVAWLKDPKTGRQLEVSTTQPGAQLYVGNWFGGETPLNPEGRPYQDYEGVAIECQHFPDSPHHPNFPSIILTPDSHFHESIVFKFLA